MPPSLRAVLARKTLDGAKLEDVTTSCIRVLHSPEPGNILHQRKLTPEARVESVLKLKKVEYDGEDVATIAARVAAYDAQKGYDAVLKAITFVPRTPKIVFGPTVTLGFYDRISKTVTLDPVKNPTADAQLDTLLFESHNAAQRSDYTAVRNLDEKLQGLATARIEFRTDKRYVQGLMASYAAASMDELVATLGIDRKYLVKADPPATGTAKVDMPDTATMPEQNKRQALRRSSGQRRPMPTT